MSSTNDDRGLGPEKETYRGQAPEMVPALLAGANPDRMEHGSAGRPAHNGKQYGNRQNG
jgi:hypothetical protein